MMKIRKKLFHAGLKGDISTKNIKSTSVHATTDYPNCKIFWTIILKDFFFD
jgi:hypothetical protein